MDEAGEGASKSSRKDGVSEVEIDFCFGSLDKDRIFNGDKDTINVK